MNTPKEESKCYGCDPSKFEIKEGAILPLCEKCEKQSFVPSNISEESWEERFMKEFDYRFSNIAKMADHGNDIGYGKGLAKLQIDILSFIKSEIEKARQGELSELIRQCGDENYFVISRYGKIWIAGSGKSPENGEAEKGSTPEEAVRNLLAALNKK